MKSVTKNVRISPKKLMPVVHGIKGMDAKKALDILRFMPKKGAKILYKSLKSAISNAEHNDAQDPDMLMIDTIQVSKGMVMKRGQAISRGRYHRILKRSSNIVISLTSK